MKKTAIIAVLILCLTLVGCGMEKTEVAPVELAKVAFEAEGEVKILQDRIKDDDFWESTYRAADLIEETIDDGKLASVSFKLRTSENKTILLEDIYSFRLIDTDDLWIKLTVNQIIYALVTSDEVIEAESSGISLTVESIILKWSTPGFDEKMIASVCDVDNDGKWDYICKGKMYFTDINATVVPIDESGYGIGNSSVKNPKVFKINGEAKLANLTLAVSD
ncbi:hypothetical protein IKE97_00185 [Candidatus Saccharibacteria bacterium]|nr:hypothetical protein [Candidatus Saccharibacteria bacterium]